MQIAQLVTKKRRRGFTIIEVAVAIAFTGLTILAVYSGLSYCFGMVQVSREAERATQIMLDQMERIRLLTWCQVQNSCPDGKIYCPDEPYTEYYYPPGIATGEAGIPYTVDIDVIAPAPPEVIPASVDYVDDMLQVVIKVSWESGNGPRTREMKTLVAKKGMQRYIGFN